LDGVSERSIWLRAIRIWIVPIVDFYAPMIPLDIGYVKDCVAQIDKRIFKKVNYYTKFKNGNYERDIKNKSWIPLQLNIAASSVLLLQNIIMNKGLFSWAGDWHIPRVNSRRHPCLNIPKSRLRSMDVLWPTNVLKLLNLLPQIDLQMELTYKRLLNNDSLVELVCGRWM